jgi:hypothetical protein
VGAACDVIPRLFFQVPTGTVKFLYPNDPLILQDFVPQSPRNPEFYPTTPLHGVSATL